METRFSQALLRELKTGASLPMLSPQAAKIQSESLKKDPHFSILAGLIRKDPALTGEILRIANSPFFKGIGEVETLKDALTRLGQTEMVNIIISVIHQKNFRSANPWIRDLYAGLWRHSLACAAGSLWTARHLSLKEDIPKAFIAGLLHDIGKLHILAALEKTMPDNGAGLPRPDLEEILQKHHAELGYAMLTAWHLPESYCVVARDHHGLKASAPLMVVVRLANTLVNLFQTAPQAMAREKISRSREFRQLGLGPAELDELVAYIENALSTTPVS